MIIRLSMHFDEQEYKDNYEDLTDEQIVELCMEDFIDTVHQQWNDEEFKQALEVINV